MELSYEQLLNKAPKTYINNVIEQNRFNIGSEALRVRNSIDQFGSSTSIHNEIQDEQVNTSIEYQYQFSSSQHSHTFQYEKTPIVLTIDSEEYTTFPQKILAPKGLGLEKFSDNKKEISTDYVTFSILSEDLDNQKITLQIAENNTTHEEASVLNVPMGAYIDTGIIPNNTTRTEFIFEKEDFQANWTAFFGADQANVNRSYWIGYNDSTKRTTIQNGTNIYKDSDFTINYNQKYNFTQNGNIFLIDGVTHATVSMQSYTAPVNMTLFGVNRNNNVENYLNCVFYSCKIWDSEGTLLRDFTPTLDTNSIPCLHDSVSGKYFYNKGTGNFQYIEYKNSQKKITQILNNVNSISDLKIVITSDNEKIIYQVFNNNTLITSILGRNLTNDDYFTIDNTIYSISDTNLNTNGNPTYIPFNT